jgi:hypothetical protein
MNTNLQAIDEALAYAQSPLVVDFLTYIRSIQPADRLPSRAAFDPGAIRRLLPNIVLVEVERPPAPALPRFFVRLAGQSVLDAHPNIEMKRYLDEMLTENGTEIAVNVRHRVLETRRTYYYRGPARFKFKLDYNDIEYAHCPLSDDGVDVDRIVSIFVYNVKDEAQAAQKRRAE